VLWCWTWVPALLVSRSPLSPPSCSWPSAAARSRELPAEPGEQAAIPRTRRTRGALVKPQPRATRLQREPSDAGKGNSRPGEPNRLAHNFCWNRNLHAVSINFFYFFIYYQTHILLQLPLPTADEKISIPKSMFRWQLAELTARSWFTTSPLSFGNPSTEPGPDPFITALLENWVE